MADESLPQKHLMRRSFDRAASAYDAAAVLQRRVGEQLERLLDVLEAAPACILDAGSGTGHGVGLLERRFPRAWIVQLDIALGMVATGYDRAPHTGAVCADIERLVFADCVFDLIWCNLALQWAEDLQRSLSELRRVLRPGGWVVFSTLGPDTLHELRRAFEGVDDNRHVNRFVDALTLKAQVETAGFVGTQLSGEPHVMEYDNVRDLMRELKAIGAHNVTRGRPGGMMGKSKWQRVEENYERFRRRGVLPATYEVYFVSARRPSGSAG
jgi:malonyl-CoA O-methyltransferase